MNKILGILLGIIIFGCDGNTDFGDPELANPVEEKQKEVIMIHDRVMKEMSQLDDMGRKLYKAGEKREDSLDFYSHAAEVELAKERMMQWMRQYKNPETLDKSVEEKLEYLDKEKAEIQDIENFTTKVLEKGEELLKRVPEPVQIRN